MADTMSYLDAIRHYADSGIESRKALASRAGVARSTLYAILGGSSRRVNSVDNIERLLGAIGYRLVAEPMPADGDGIPAVAGIPPAIVQGFAAAGFEIRHLPSA